MSPSLAKKYLRPSAGRSCLLPFFGRQSRKTSDRSAAAVAELADLRCYIRTAVASGYRAAALANGRCRARCLCKSHLRWTSAGRSAASDRANAPATASRLVRLLCALSGCGSWPPQLRGCAERRRVVLASARRRRAPPGRPRHTSSTPAMMRLLLVFGSHLHDVAAPARR